ncbi:DnaA regulatory inactivator HdaA [Pseudohoeflea coraliihabitans]|uniref:Chromosomal replication initiator protein DnaA domain-containing protein n=1 Tax=Pseudohoeflea coraliihabitans TaxID=2860393 RepID=A0ABS6WUL2_9HYPH|nr:DnaA regulatory inactivator HdaA [Pseudohoeflea sp. DP4N28-3]MBW3098745.1 hypothetical protein [Pseudohoeflea sp. DP4N28-3]
MASNHRHPAAPPPQGPRPAADQPEDQNPPPAPARESRHKSGRGAGQEPGQLPLDFGHRPAASRDDLIESDGLAGALGLIDSWPHWPSPVVILAGPTGSGKSHLASIWVDKSGAVPVDLNADAAAAMAVAARGPVLIEDVDRGALNEADLFHLINTVRANGTALMMTSRLWPASWPVTLADLVSRLKAATTVEIGEPDDALLAQLLVKLFADRQIDAEQRVIAYLVSRMERSLATAVALVARLDALALARQSKISLRLAAEVLEEMDRGAV